MSTRPSWKAPGIVAPRAWRMGTRVLGTRVLGRRVLGTAALGAVVAGAGCDGVTLAPDLPASIEWAPFPAPAVVVGDTLRTEAGVVARVRAIVRNTAGDTLPAAAATYLYADFARDSALLVDSTGLVRAVKTPRGDARLAARAGVSLQVLRPLVVTSRPDSATGRGPGALLVLNTADTGRTAATANTSAALSVTVRTIASATSVEPVNAWLVRYELLRPANPANDTTRGAWLVDDNGRPTAADTTDSGGEASRKVRVRPSVFPAAAGTDTVVVQAVVRYRGVPVRGAPVRLVIPVQRR